ncbi:BA75_01626T0 [Komagataella pastoris]|uniref:1,3-beta-glucanosyltransferase n=1 Tax=Komagataella pastoris TaxID=4922 RepID=A0A1B2J7P6_PICPA|nr:BA75_01626T0 [Komagataella pastoris]
MLSILSALTLLGLSCASDLTPPIEVTGNKFFFSNNGSQFYMKGIAYQQDTSNSTTTDTFIDPLANVETCRRDFPYLEQLHTNVIRVYAIDVDADHDECMQLLEEAGIYVIADLSEPGDSIITTDPAWDVHLYDRYTSVIDEMQQYDNVLGFFAGNEVITNRSNTDAAPFVKAAIRDMKTYMEDQGYRQIPIGYSANDDALTRISSANYFACGDSDVRADFYGYNIYSWCGRSSFTTSGYDDRTEDFRNLSVPLFFSEYGCNEVQPRLFTEVEALYGPNMTDVWSGGIVYMYFEEENNYGLVTIEPDGDVSTYSDFNYLRSELATISPSLATQSEVSATATELECPPTGNNWRASTDLPPTPNKEVCDCLQNTLACVVSDDVEPEDYADIFNYVCSRVECGDIGTDAEIGEYGPYSFCDAKEKLSFVLNLYYEDQNGAASACDFDGSASVVSTTIVSSCASILESASTVGTAPSSSRTSTGSGSSGTGSGSGSSADATSTESDDAAFIHKPKSGSELLMAAFFVTFVTSGFTYTLL